MQIHSVSLEPPSLDLVHILEQFSYCRFDVSIVVFEPADVTHCVVLIKVQPRGCPLAVGAHARQIILDVRSDAALTLIARNTSLLVIHWCILAHIKQFHKVLIRFLLLVYRGVIRVAAAGASVSSGGVCRERFIQIDWRCRH